MEVFFQTLTLILEVKRKIPLKLVQVKLISLSCTWVCSVNFLSFVACKQHTSLVLKDLDNGCF